MDESKLLTMSEEEFKAFTKARNKERAELVRLEQKYKKFAHDRAASLYNKNLKNEKLKEKLKQKQAIARTNSNRKFAKKLSKAIPRFSPSFSAAGRQRLLNQLSQGPRPGNILNAPNSFYTTKRKKIEYKL